MAAPTEPSQQVRQERWGVVQTMPTSIQEEDLLIQSLDWPVAATEAYTPHPDVGRPAGLRQARGFGLPLSANHPACCPSICYLRTAPCGEQHHEGWSHKRIDRLHRPSKLETQSAVAL